MLHKDAEMVVNCAPELLVLFDETQLESVMSNVSYKADDVISTLEKKLHDLKEKNKNLQKNKGEDLKNEPFTQTV